MPLLLQAFVSPLNLVIVTLLPLFVLVGLHLRSYESKEVERGRQGREDMR